MKVSIIITNYNYARFLPEAVESVLNQSYPFKELIVVDDGSTDNSREILARYADCALIIHQSNKGHTAAMMAGFAASSGEAIYFLDSDDKLVIGALDSAMSLFDRSVSRVQFRVNHINAEGESLSGYWPKPSPPNHPVTLDTYRRFGAFFSPPQSGNIYRRIVLDYVYPANHVKAGLDTALIAASSLFGTAYHIDKALAHYRCHDSNISEVSGMSLTKCRRRLRAQIDAESILADLARVRGVRYVFGEGLNRSAAHFKLRLISLCADAAGHPLKRDTRLRLMLKGIWASLGETYRPLHHRLKAMLFFPLIAILPSRFVLWVGPHLFTRDLRQAGATALRRKVLKA
jgi:glycosyltransferase involved in cell wall biosynthesis